MLSELHSELTRAQPVDAANRALLTQLASDIQAVNAAQTPVTPDRYRSLRARLADGATGVEATHPKLASAIERVIDTLALFNI